MISACDYMFALNASLAKFMAEACMSAKEISPRDLVSTKEEKNQGGDVQARAITRIDCRKKILDSAARRVSPCGACVSVRSRSNLLSTPAVRLYPLNNLSTIHSHTIHPLSLSLLELDSLFSVVSPSCFFD
jgi:hypothetical protein